VIGRGAPGAAKVRLNRRGRRLLERRPRGRRFRVVFSVSDGDGATSTDVDRTRFRRKRGGGRR
jgi:hypothetical protein